MDKNSKIYITGHRGMVGSTVCELLKKNGYNDLIFKSSNELDLRDQKKTENFIKEERPGYIFLFASKVGGIQANIDYPAEFLYDNLMIESNIINAAYKYKVKKILYLGSSCIYPRNCSQPMEEEYLLTGKLEPTNEPYAIAKIAGLKLCRYYNEQHGTNYISLIASNLYGPNDNFNLHTSHVLPALLRKFHIGKLLENGQYGVIKKDIIRYQLGFNLDETINLNSINSVDKHLKQIGISKDKITLWGTGEPFREFLLVNDLADACVYFMKNFDAKDIGEFINIGTGEGIRIKKLAEIIKGAVGYKGKLNWDISKASGMPRKVLDVTKMKKFDWSPSASLEEGIKKTYKWYLNK